MSDDSYHRGWDERIYSPTNPTIKLARSLHRRRVRYRERAILVEGSRAILAALELGVSIRALLIDASRVEDIDKSLIAALREAARRVLLVDAHLFQDIADTEHPQPLVAICEMTPTELPPDCTFVVALDAIRDPGNLGTLVRSIAAAGADGVAVLPGCVDPYNGKAIRASAGSIFAIPVQPFAGVDDIVSRSFLDRPIVAIADSDGNQHYDQVDWRGAALLIIGGEASGANESVRTYADIVVDIPMATGIESLNAGVAGAIIAFEIARQRRRRQ